VAPELELNPVTTLALSAIICRKSRPFNGRSTMRRFSMTDPTVAFSVVNCAAEALTSMVSVTRPISIVKSTLTVD
jgi:hypothetical protein